MGPAQGCGKVSKCGFTATHLNALESTVRPPNNPGTNAPPPAKIGPSGSFADGAPAHVGKCSPEQNLASESIASSVKSRRSSNRNPSAIFDSGRRRARFQCRDAKPIPGREPEALGQPVFGDAFGSPASNPHSHRAGLTTPSLNGFVLPSPPQSGPVRPLNKSRFPAAIPSQFSAALPASESAAPATPYYGPRILWQMQWSLVSERSPWLPRQTSIAKDSGAPWDCGRTPMERTLIRFEANPISALAWV